MKDLRIIIGLILLLIGGTVLLSAFRPGNPHFTDNLIGSILMLAASSILLFGFDNVKNFISNIINSKSQFITQKSDVKFSEGDNQLYSKKICNECGQTQPDSNTGNFCVYCGISLKDTNSERICKTCGAKVPKDQLFCGECGTKY